MRVLLDTHAIIWYFESDARLSPTALAAIDDTANHPSVSIASAWEMAIKTSNGRLHLEVSLQTMLSEGLTAAGITLLQLSLAHIFAVTTLPQHHRDPFDRMLIAQALVEQLPIVSIDTALDAYGIERIW